MFTINCEGLIRQMIGYAIVGSVGTIAHYTVLILSVESGLMDSIIATCFGFIVGAVINHLMNHFFVFKSNKNSKKTATKFYMVAIGGFFLNLSVFYLMKDIFILNYFFSQVFATISIFSLTFIVNRNWTF